MVAAPARRGLAAAAVLAVAGCTAAEPAATRAPASTAATASPTTSPSPSATGPGPAPTTTTPVPTSTVRPVARVEPERMLRTVRTLAGEIGPREATGPAYRRAAALVERRLEQLGYEVRRQRLRVPRGVSWGVPVPSGTTTNVVAVPPGFDPRRPHLVVGAHLDTVPQAPGAEDNASGVAALLEVARLAALREPALPTVFAAFGAEEPRGPGDDLHHFGSQHYVRQMRAAQRAALVGMLSLDRVGVGETVPVCWGGREDGRFARQVRAAARQAGVPARLCDDNRSSDHWSFERAGLPAARLGSTPYSAYHSAADLPRVVDRDQLARSARVAWQVVSAGGR